MNNQHSKFALLASLSALALLFAGCATPMPRPDATVARRIGPLAEWQSTAAGASLTGVAGYHFGGNNAINLGEIYLDVPVRARFNIPVGGRNNLFLFTGPVLSVNLVSIDAHASGTTNNYETDKDLRRFDVMFGFGVGIDIIEHIRVALGFDYGLLDRVASPDRKCHHSQLKLGVQYIF